MVPGPALRTVAREELERPPRPPLAEALERGEVLFFPPGFETLMTLPPGLNTVAAAPSVSAEPLVEFTT